MEKHFNIEISSLFLLVFTSPGPNEYLSHTICCNRFVIFAYLHDL